MMVFWIFLGVQVSMDNTVTYPIPESHTISVKIGKLTSDSCSAYETGSDKLLLNDLLLVSSMVKIMGPPYGYMNDRGINN